MTIEKIKEITKSLQTNVLKKWLREAKQERDCPIPLGDRTHLLESIEIMEKELKSRE